MFDLLAQSLINDDIVRSNSKSMTDDNDEYLNWHQPAAGVLVLEPNTPTQHDVVISAAIHGNETAPVEITAQILQALLTGQLKLSVRLMVILGNLPAMRSGKRYQQLDMNRLFSAQHAKHPSCYETERAAQLEQLVSEFYNPTLYEQTTERTRFHFDLHTAIKPSHHVRFGLLPYVESGQYQSEMLTWLQSVGLEALVINHAPAGTFSYFTSHRFHAQSCTLELGKALPFGHNNLSQFEGIRQGLINLVTATSAATPSLASLALTKDTSPLQVYKVCQVLTKHTEQFTFTFDENLYNFTEFHAGLVLAHDGKHRYQVGDKSEYLLFPNSRVKIGFRAGLMLTKVALEEIIKV